MENDHATVEKLVTDNMGLAYFFAGRAIDIDHHEAVSRAMAGLMRAAQKFDATNGCSFGTYATYWIKQKIHLVRVERRTHKRGSETAVHFHLETPMARGMGGESVRTVADIIADPNADPLKSIDTAPDVAMIRKAIGKLPPQYREVIRRRFGIGTEREQNNAEIAISMGYTREYIRQVVERSLKKLRPIMAELENSLELLAEEASEELAAL